MDAGEVEIVVEIPKGSQTSDEKILRVPLRDPMWSLVTELDQIPQPLLNEIERFFKVYKDLEGHTVSTDGFDGRQTAARIIEEARSRLVSRA